jgi:hypothetical protein
MTSNSNKTTIHLEHSLQAFFFDELQSINKKSTRPIPNEMIFYSSIVLDRYADSANYFSVEEDGSVKDKVLGMKLLEASQMTARQKQMELKEVGDTALILCGIFSESVNRKITDISYYQSLGQSAYQQLNNIIPELYEMPDFYLNVSHFFHQIMSLLSVVSSELLSNNSDDQFLLFSNKIKVT